MKKISKILIANRGEIAVRIIRAAKEMGIQSVVIYSDVDKNGLHVHLSDQCFLLRRGKIEPYLDMDQIIEIAKQANVDAIHPGYGFLSENHVFAQKVADANLIFVGPSSESINRMGDKLRAKNLAEKVGVPTVPGFQVTNIDEKDNIRSQCLSIGFPVLIKARAGGGGKGMRLVHSPEHLYEGIDRAVSEARDAFGDGSIFIEKYIQNPRHIEIQVLADQHGNAVHLFERECSIQRRHQKVIEESPSVAVDDRLRSKMGESAVMLTKACKYVNAGTIEFVMDQQKDFYFLEMNTRLQVEHPVTEYISGIDLVKQQVRIAEGEMLDFKQEDLETNGHAIELRVYAEDPDNEFMPDIGKLTRYRIPRGMGVRVDDGYEEGMDIPVEYDPLIAKLIVFGNDRLEAISRMKRALEEYVIEGVKNTLAFGHQVMNDEDFYEGNIDTSFIARKLKKFKTHNKEEAEMIVAAILGHEVYSDETSIKFKNSYNCQSKWRRRLIE